MSRALSRRGFVAGAAALALASPRLGVARPTSPAPLPALPIRPHVARKRPLRVGDPERAVVDADFVAEQLANVAELFTPLGVTFTAAAPLELAPSFAALETRADRDALGAELEAHVVNVFFVDSLRDVDDPSLYRMGVTWRRLTDLTKKYVVVAASARPTTMAHELGHYFGLDHTSVKNNLMSYDRDGGTVFLDARQGSTVRRTAEVLYRTGALVPPEGGAAAPSTPGPRR